MSIFGFLCFIITVVNRIQPDFFDNWIFNNKNQILRVELILRYV